MQNSGQDAEKVDKVDKDKLLRDKDTEIDYLRELLKQRD